LNSYIIDGNNLIGKIKALNQLHTKNKVSSAEKLAFMIGRYFQDKKVSVNLHFDGFLSEDIKAPGLKIFYSGKLTADEKIKSEIAKSSNPKNIILVTSDNNLAEFGRVCRCQVVKSEEFSKMILSSDSIDEEKTKIDELNNINEFRKLFGIV